MVKTVIQATEMAVKNKSKAELEGILDGLEAERQSYGRGDIARIKTVCKKKGVINVLYGDQIRLAKIARLKEANRVMIEAKERLKLTSTGISLWEKAKIGRPTGYPS